MNAQVHNHRRRALFVTTVPVTLDAFLLPLARALQVNGWRVDALTGVEGELPDCLLATFGFVHRVGWSRSLGSFVHYGRLARQIRAIVREGSYDVVHTHTPIASLVTRLALRHVRGVRVIYTAHGFHFYQGQRSRWQGWLFRWAEKLCTRWTDVLVVMNDEDELAARTLVASADGCARCQVERIDGIGIDLDEWTPVTLSAKREKELRELYALPSGTFAVIMIAEMNENKRHGLVLDALSIYCRGALHAPTPALCRERTTVRSAAASDTPPPPLRALFIGTGPLEAELRKRVRDENLPVIFAGQLEHEPLRELLSLVGSENGGEGGIGLLVSEREGLPRSLMEFTAAGIAIAGTRTRGITDEVRDERALATDATGAAIATLVIRLAEDAPLRKELAQAQKAHASTHYAQEVILPRYLKLYQ